MMIEFVILVGRIAILCLIISSILYLIKFNQLSVSIKVLGLFLLINLTIELYAKWLSFHFRDNIFLLHIYTFFEFIVWIIFYRVVFQDKKWVRVLFPWVITTGACLIIANTLFLEPLQLFNSNAKTFVQVLLVSAAIYYFFSSFGKIDFTRPVQFGMSMINFAVILYYSGSLFIFMYSKLLNSHDVSNSNQYIFWAINAVLNLIFQILILISLWTIAFRKAKS